MSQLLRHLIVIINLIPSCLCFAQEGANKTPPTSPAQKPETELQRPNSAQGSKPNRCASCRYGRIPDSRIIAGSQFLGGSDYY